MKIKTLLVLFGCLGVFAAAEARHHHGSRGVRLATDIVNLVGASLNLINPRPVVVAPAPAPVVVTPAPVVVAPPPPPVVVAPPPPPRPVIVAPPPPRPVIVAPPPRRPVVVTPLAPRRHAPPHSHGRPQGRRR